MYAFDVTYSEAEAADAERAFLRRSVKELRGWYNTAVLIVAPLLLAAALAFQAPKWIVFSMAILMLVALALPAFFYIARPAEARRRARKFPIRHVELGREGVEVTAGGRRGAIPWGRIRYVWTAGDAVLLVLNPYMFLTIPRNQLPEGAYDYMLAATRLA